MQPEARPLVVLAELEAAELGDRLLLAVEVHLLDLAAELADAVGGGVDVVDAEEHVRRRLLVAAVHPAGDVRRRDAEAAPPEGPGSKVQPKSAS